MSGAPHDTAIGWWQWPPTAANPDHAWAAGGEKQKVEVLL